MECPKDTLCLNVKAMSAGDLAEGRTAVMWYQLDDDSSDPVPVIGYEAAFDPTTSRIDIPLSSISPPDEGNLLCDRMCNDEAACPCLTDRKVGFGFVFVADDINEDGKLDGEEIFDSDYGYGYMALAYSEKAWIPSPSPDFDKIFPEGSTWASAPTASLRSMTTTSWAVRWAARCSTFVSAPRRTPSATRGGSSGWILHNGTEQKAYLSPIRRDDHVFSGRWRPSRPSRSAGIRRLA